jgi:hypothetical protein
MVEADDSTVLTRAKELCAQDGFVGNDRYRRFGRLWPGLPSY